MPPQPMIPTPMVDILNYRLAKRSVLGMRPAGMPAQKLKRLAKRRANKIRAAPYSFSAR